MIKDSRIKQIIDMLNLNGVVETAELSKLFNVTEITIRRDLDELAGKGLVARTHGGATLVTGSSVIEPPFEIRVVQHTAEKEIIAKKAAEMVKSGTKIMLDSGTSTFFLAQNLDYSLKIVVVTNAINIAYELSNHINTSVLFIGGELRNNTLSCAGYFAEEAIRRTKVKQAFIAVSGIGLNGELYSESAVEVGVKSAMMKAAEQKIILADSSKLGKDEFISFGNAVECKYIITDNNISSQLLKHYNNLGINILIAESEKKS